MVKRTASVESTTRSGVRAKANEALRNFVQQNPLPGLDGAKRTDLARHRTTPSARKEHRFAFAQAQHAHTEVSRPD